MTIHSHKNICDTAIHKAENTPTPNSANTFHDAEVAALCAPRKLYVAVGKEDSVFDYKSAASEAKRVHKYFEAFGCPENFVFSAWDGGHTMPDDDAGLDFMFSAFGE